MEVHRIIIFVVVKISLFLKKTWVCYIPWQNGLAKPRERNWIQFCNPYISATGWCKHLIFQIYIIWSNNIHSLKCQRSTTLGCKDIAIKKFEFVAKTQFLWMRFWDLKMSLVYFHGGVTTKYFLIIFTIEYLVFTNITNSVCFTLFVEFYLFK